jgi:ATP-dependent Lhr-like helicase
VRAFDRLHPALQHHVVNSLGWSSLRPLQEQAIEPVLDGEHAVLVAPTAGGKTEAAALPVVSRMLSEHWTGMSVLYLCPLRALLNNLEHCLLTCVPSSSTNCTRLVVMIVAGTCWPYWSGCPG